ncbi:MAG: membrane dipeptidase [Chitinophagaceae bacterium]
MTGFSVTMANYEQKLSRRKFIAISAGASAAIVFNPFSSWTVDKIDPKVYAIVKRTIGIDSHNHIDVPLETNELPGPEVKLAGEMQKSGLSAICMTFATDYKRNIVPGEAYQRFTNGLIAMDAMLANNKMNRSLNMADVNNAHKNHESTVIQSVEGCHFLEGKLNRVGVAYSRGLRHLGLLHDSDAAIPLGDVYTNTAKFGGLTSFGGDVIRECNKLGILIDLAHASNDTLNAALKITKHPVLISHTGLDTQLGQDEFIAKMMRPRLISKEQAKIVADSGGVIGVWTHLADTPLDYAKNIKTMVDVAGIDHVCIGTDTKLTPPYRSPKDGGFGSKPGDKQGDTKPGNKKEANRNDNGKRPGERTNETWAAQKAGFYYVVVDALLKAGFNEEEIAKIGGGNYCRIFSAATDAH